ncbi:MAG: hypothetical protein RLZZ04_4578, partial [Cyanobacteriota bacterium]
MKQQLRAGIVLNLSILSILGIFDSSASGTEYQVEPELGATTIQEWRLGKAHASRSQLANFPVEITGIEVRSTTKGIEIVLKTANGEILRGIISTQGNNLAIDLPNARLKLPEDRFVRQNPAEGISAITTTALGKNKIRVIVAGIKGTPRGETIRTSQGLTISVTPPASVADTAAPPDQVINIIVTAQKQPEKLQDVPISLTTLSQEDIKDARINSFRDVTANTRDSISFFIDDVPYENVHQLLPGALFDLERVEVLRGPQSTLYGRNSAAGVVNVISRKPTNSPEITLDASYGNFNERQLQFSASDAVIDDRLAFRIAGVYDARDGFTENTFLDEDANNLSSIGGRGNLVWTPSKQWNISFNATGAANNDGDNTYVPLNQENPFETELNIPGNTDLSINTQSLRVAYTGTAFNLTSITARNGSNLNYNADGDYSSEDLFEFDTRQETTIVSQEIRLQSPDDAERLRWTVGGYF